MSQLILVCRALEGVPYITEEAFEQIEKLLGGLLIEASGKEAANILHIHKRIKTVYDRQTAQDYTITRLRQLAS